MFTRVSRLLSFFIIVGPCPAVNPGESVVAIASGRQITPIAVQSRHAFEDHGHAAVAYFDAFAGVRVGARICMHLLW